MKLTLTVDSKDEGRAIKHYVRGAAGISYHAFSQLKASEGMLVNGTPVHANHILHAGDIVTLQLEEPAAGPFAAPEEGGVNIVWEDDDLMIIDKIAPMACQCGERNPGGTLENRLAFVYPELIFRPLNRLDKGTSGLMAAAKNAHVCQLLQKQLHTEAFVRRYLAVCEGVFEGAGVIDAPIGKAPGATVMRMVDPENGKEAVTRYECLYSGNGRTVVRLQLETGRTHQIRVHMASVGHPVCGDFLYGWELTELPRRFALHSAYISFTHPMTGKTVEATSPLPAELEVLCK